MSSNAKEFRFDAEARICLKEGICQLAEAVEITLGPRGKNVGLQTNSSSPIITSDGYSIAKEIELKDPFLNMGASFAKEVSAKIKEKAGDGTTTGIVLLKSIVQYAVKQITAGINPIFIKRGMEFALDAILKNIDGMSIELKTDLEIKNIANVSSAGFDEIAETIATCIKKVGKDGIISIEDGKKTETIVEHADGVEIESGYISPYFCTNPEKGVVDFHHPLILITDQKIRSCQEILPLLQQITATGENLLIIAEDIESDALSTLVMNSLRGSIKVAAIKAPKFGDLRKAVLEDLAILTGANFICEEKGLSLQETTLSDLGNAERIIVGKNKTSIVQGSGNPDAIEKRLQQIEAQIKLSKSSYEKELFEERKATFSSQAAIIYVGAYTDSERSKKKQAYEDSLHATRAAIEEGIVPGGGIALLRAARAVTIDLPKEEAIGAQILIKACEAPFRQIVSNAGFDSSVLLEKVLNSVKTFGFNVLSEKVEDFLISGVIDPAKVVKNSLIHAVSIGAVVLLTDSLISDLYSD